MQGRPGMEDGCEETREGEFLLNWPNRIVGEGRPRWWDTRVRGWGIWSGIKGRRILSHWLSRLPAQMALQAWWGRGTRRRLVEKRAWRSLTQVWPRRESLLSQPPPRVRLLFGQKCFSQWVASNQWLALSPPIWSLCTLCYFWLPLSSWNFFLLSFKTLCSPATPFLPSHCSSVSSVCCLKCLLFRNGPPFLTRQSRGFDSAHNVGDS